MTAGRFVRMPPAELKDQRLHTMVTATMRRQIDAASRIPGFKTESDVVRYALEQVLPQILAEKAVPASDSERYKGRTRLLVDTAEPEREKRVGTPREPVRLRPLDDTEVRPFADKLEEFAAEMAAAAEVQLDIRPRPTSAEVLASLTPQQRATIAVDSFDAACSSLGITPRPPVTNPFVSDDDAATA